MKIIISWSLSLLALFLCHSAFADHVEGHLHRDSSGVSIHLTTNHKSYKLTSVTTEVQEVIGRLGSFDFVRGQGQVRADQVVLETVDFIGLKNLLGAWSLAGGAFVTFKDFLNASYTIPDFFYPDRVEDYTYSLAPGESKAWRILVSNGSWVSVGYLEINKNKLKVQFVDLKTGNLKKPLEMTRAAP